MGTKLSTIKNTIKNTINRPCQPKANSPPSGTKTGSISRFRSYLRQVEQNVLLDGAFYFFRSVDF